MSMHMDLAMHIDAHALATCRWCDSVRGEQIPLPVHEPLTPRP
jgi:hypothetical protein